VALSPDYFFLVILINHKIIVDVEQNFAFTEFFICVDDGKSDRSGFSISDTKGGISKITVWIRKTIGLDKATDGG